MKDRIKAARKALGLTQVEFSSRVHIVQGTLSAYEVGVSVPSDSVIANMVHEFGISESWLRTGEGEMFTPVDPDEEAAMVIGKVFAQDGDQFRKRLLHIVATLPDDQLHMVFDLAKRMVGGDDPADQ